jgi:hypothetical protein
MRFGFDRCLICSALLMNLLFDFEHLAPGVEPATLTYTMR